MTIASPSPGVLADTLPKSWGRDILLVVGGAAFVGIAAQIAIPLPFTPVPLTAQTFAVLLAGAALGSLRGVLSMLLYAVAGMAGLPWFAGGKSGGFAMPSFGYIIGFVVAAGLVGLLAERGWSRDPLRTAGAMVLGNIVIYLFGVVWLYYVTSSSSWATTIGQGLTPFLLGDVLKIVIAAGLFPLVWRQIGNREVNEPDAGSGSD